MFDVKEAVSWPVTVWAAEEGGHITPGYYTRVGTYVAVLHWGLTPKFGHVKLVSKT